MKKSGALAVLRERKRQLTLGHSPNSDLKHDKGQLAFAAAAYLVRNGFHKKTPPSYWPWKDSEWKPLDDRIQELVKAGALLLAEIDRLELVREALKK